MRERLLALAERRAHLVARAQDERARINALLAPSDRATVLAVSLIGTMRRALEEVRRHPLFVVAGVVLLVALRPRRVLSLLAQGWSLWRLYREARRWWLRFESATAPAGAPAPRPGRFQSFQR